VSINNLKNGTLLHLADSNETFYYRNRKQSGDNWVDDLLDKYKPMNAPSRKQTFYAFDSLANCYRFNKSLGNKNKTVFYYKVKLYNPYKTVMSLTDFIFKLGKNSSELDKIAQEYWFPSLDWKFYEYLSNKMTIIETLSEPDYLSKIQGDCNYNNDFDLRKKLLQLK